MTFDYAKAGVDISKVKGILAGIDTAIKSTHNKSVLPIQGHYAGFIKLGSQTLAMHTDGVGTKVLVAQHMRRFDTVGIDCVAMNVNDIICTGARPLALVDYLAIENEDNLLVGELMKGLVKGAKEAETPIVGGETAIMGDVIKGIDGCTGFDLAATCIGVIETKNGKPITGEEMKAGDVVVGLESSGIHSNGLTLARKVLGLSQWGNELLTPTKIYVKPIMQMVAQLHIHGIAHITGGAFSKLSRLTAYSKVGISLDSMPSSPAIFDTIKMNARLDDTQMHKTFNMGVGMCVMLPAKEADEAIAIAKKSSIAAWKIGKVTKEKGVLVKGLKLA
ncbi:MAG: phosphoribosylformylglycinamidine cyclo-ligase [Candidatus Micrarchaeia archaeon]|jgi:phosphoribosylformylglycinamidine cyclo-ligase